MRQVSTISELTEPEALALLTAGGALQGPLFDSLLARLRHAPVELEAGARVGPFEVVQTLARGGMAVVYLAERADGEFEQRVALKLVAPDGALGTERELLRRERQILAGLEHPSIARLIDGGTTPGGALWFAMELVEGERIDHWCESKAAGTRQRVERFVEVCDAVQFAHARLLVHRDLKPSNILVTRDGAVKLLDFGIAAIAHPDHAHATPRALTPGWASPEQRAGEPETTASDVWQLGRLLETLVAPVSPRMDRDLAAIIARARHDAVESRYATVADFAADVRAWLSSRPVAARGGGVAYRSARFVARHRLWSAAAAAALAAFIALGVTFTIRLAQERDAAEREAARANATVGFLVDLFRANEPSASRGRVVDARELLRAGEARIGELDGQPDVQARLLLAIARIHDSLGDPLRARELLDRAVAAARAAPSIDPAMLADAALARAEVVLHMGHPLDVLRLLDELEPSLADAPGGGRRERLGWLSLRAMAEMGSGDLAAASRSAQDALRLAVQLDGPESAAAASRHNDLGIVHRARGDLSAAATAFADAERIWKALHGPDHPRAVSAQKNRAGALIELGDLDRGGPMLLEAIERHRVLFGARGAEYGAALRARARLHTLRGEHAEALAQLDQSLATLEETLEPESTAIAYTLQARADVHSKLGQAAAALRDYERALAIRRARLPAGHLDIAGSLAGASVQHWRLGQYAQAERAARESYEIRRARRGESDVLALRSLALIGLALAGQGNAEGAATIHASARSAATDDAARAELERLITTPEAVLGPRTPES